MKPSFTTGGSELVVKSSLWW